MGDFSFALVLPVATLAAYGLLVLLMVPMLRGNPRVLAVAALIGMVVTGWLLVRLWDQWQALGPLDTAFGMVRMDGFGLFFSFILLGVGALTVLASTPFLEREGVDHGEFYALLLLCLAGMMLMVQTTHLMMVLIGLEIFSLALYVMTGITRGRAASVESALKYFLLGAFSSGFMVYGMALIYGAARSLDLVQISRAVAAGPGKMLLVGMGLFLVGLSFKIGAVPFHQWVPDVYQGAPTNVTGFMAAATKTAAFAVLLRFLVGGFGDNAEIWVPMITWLSILSMTVANLVALAQTNLKRLLAFSSIAHAGYLLIAVVAGAGSGVRAILFYLTAYAVMTVGVFVLLAAVGRGDAESERGYELSDYAGLGWQRPMLGLAMTIFLVSLAGIPPTGGFLGKYVVFQAAIESKHYVLAIIGVLNATVAAYYYLRVIVTMYMREPESDELPLPVPAAMAAVMCITVAGVFYLGLAPGRILGIIQSLTDALI